MRRLGLLVAVLMVPAVVSAADKKDDHKKTDDRRPEGSVVALAAPPFVFGGQPVRLSVQFSGPVTSPQTFQLSSSDPAALSVPATVALTAADGETGVMAQSADTLTEKLVTIRLRRPGDGRELTARVMVRPIPQRLDRSTGEIAPGLKPPGQPPR
jgi:hypothetical protein